MRSVCALARTQKIGRALNAMVGSVHAGARSPSERAHKATDVRGTHVERVRTKRSVRAGARKAENFMRERQPATHRDHVLRQHVCVSIISTAKPPSVPKRLSERQFICARCARAGAH